MRMTAKGSTMSKIHKSQKIVKDLMKMSKYKSIPSIPSHIHSYGYTENQSTPILRKYLYF